MENVERFRLIANVLGDLYERKNNAYGNSFGETYGKLGIISAVTRISDKYNRLCNLVKNPDIDNIGESIDDTLGDMIESPENAIEERMNEMFNNDLLDRIFNYPAEIVTLNSANAKYMLLQDSKTSLWSMYNMDTAEKLDVSFSNLVVDVNTL